VERNERETQFRRQIAHRAEILDEEIGRELP
jgi:hypothetical protein